MFPKNALDFVVEDQICDSQDSYITLSESERTESHPTCHTKDAYSVTDREGGPPKKPKGAPWFCTGNLLG